MTDRVQPTGAVHQAAALFPLLDEDERAELVADIAAYGLRQPITLDPEGMLLDGRNRLAACSQAGVEPTFTTYDGDPVAYILSANIQRRNLTKEQRAMIVAEARLLAANNLTQHEAARSVAVSQALVAQATTVLRYAPELADAVKADRLSMDAAYSTAQARKYPDRDPATATLPPAVPESDVESSDQPLMTELATLRSRLAKSEAERERALEEKAGAEGWVKQTESSLEYEREQEAVRQATLAALVNGIWEAAQEDTNYSVPFDTLRRLVVKLAPSQTGEWPVRSPQMQSMLSGIFAGVFEHKSPGWQMVEAEWRAPENTGKVVGLRGALRALLTIPVAELVEDWQIDPAKKENLTDVLQTIVDDLTAFIAAVKAVSPPQLRVVPPPDAGEAGA